MPLAITSILDAPIAAQGTIVGALCCDHVGPPRHWTPDEQTFVVGRRQPRLGAAGAGRPALDGAPAAPGAEDGGDRHAGRRHRARLQQHPVGDGRLHRTGEDGHRQRRRRARAPGGGVEGGHARRRSGAADPGLQPPPGAGTRARCSWRRGDGEALEAACARRFRPRSSSTCSWSTRPDRAGRRHAGAPDRDEPLHQRLARHAGRARAAGGPARAVRGRRRLRRGASVAAGRALRPPGRRRHRARHGCRRR